MSERLIAVHFRFRQNSTEQQRQEVLTFLRANYPMVGAGGVSESRWLSAEALHAIGLPNEERANVLATLFRKHPVIEADSVRIEAQE